MKKILLYIVAVILTVFALLTLFLSTSVIFDLFDVRAKEGNYVQFVVWSNFICSLFYFFSVYGLITGKKWTYKILGISAILLIVAFAGLIIHIKTGGTYETKTIGAMVFRIAVTIGFSTFAFFTINKRKKILSA